MTLISLLFAVAIQAAAVPAPPQAQAAYDVVVTARTAPSRKAIEHLTRSITPPVEDGFARLTVPLCVKTVGFAGQAGPVVAARIGAIAELVGVGAGKPGCRANLVVMLVKGGSALVHEALQKRTDLFAGTSATELERLRADKGPVYAWSATNVVGADGEPLLRGITGGAPVLQTTNPPSRIGLSVRHDVMGTIILIEEVAVIGKTTDQIADYSAMRALAGALPPRDGGGTILTLFSPGTPPATLTDYDGAYLQALYHGRADVGYGQKVADMAAAIRDALNQDSGAPAG